MKQGNMKCDWCWKDRICGLKFKFPLECKGCMITTKQMVKDAPEVIVFGHLKGFIKHIPK